MGDIKFTNFLYNQIIISNNYIIKPAKTQNPQGTEKKNPLYTGFRLNSMVI